MQVERIWLAEVPWSQNYDNLPAFPATAIPSDIKDFIISTYPTWGYTFDSARSFKSVNGRITIQLPITELRAYTEFNYAIIRNGAIYYFYFIENPGSLYNNIANGTVTMELVRDVFLNNIKLIREAPKQLAARYTYPFIQRTSEEVGGFIADSVHIPSQIPVKETDGFEGNRYMVCWARVWTDGSFKDTAGNTKYRRGVYESQPMTPIVCYPLWVYDTYQFEKVDGWYYIPQGDEGDRLGEYPIGSDMVIGNIDNIIQVDLTYYPPFPYCIEDDCVYVKGCLGLRDENGNSYVYSRGTSTTIPVVSKIVPISGAVTYDFTIELPQAEYHDITTLDNMNFSRSIYSEMYPYKYKALYFNGKIEPLIPYPKTSKVDVIFDTSDITPFIRLKFYARDTKAQYISKPIPLDNSGQLSTAIALYDSYQRASGNKLTAQKVASIYSAIKQGLTGISSIGLGVASSASTGGTVGLSTLVSGVVGLATSPIDGAISYGSLNAQISDIKNSQDIYTIPTVNASSDPLQDLVIVRVFKWVSDEEMKTAVMNIEQYGIEHQDYVSLFSGAHKLYDYIRTVNCQLPNIVNKNERATLERIFNRGATMWYLLGENVSTDYREYVIGMRKECMNEQTTIESWL